MILDLTCLWKYLWGIYAFGLRECIIIMEVQMGPGLHLFLLYAKNNVENIVL